MKAEPFYKFNIRAEADEPANAELLIYSVIGDWEDMGEQSAKGFATELSKLPSSVKRLDIHINSPGGSMAEANAIYSRLADHKSQKIVYIDGLAASAASIVAMVGYKIYIRANANMMIHLPSALALGNADDMRIVAAALDSVTESMINVYARRTKLERDEIRDLLAAETWFSPQQAVDKGFADELRGVIKTAAIAGTKHVIVNGIEHDLSRFHNTPPALSATTSTNTMPKPTKPTAEQPTAPAAAATPPEETDEEREEREERERRERETPHPSQPPPPAPPPPNTVPQQPVAPQPAAAVTEFEKGVQHERSRVLALQKLDKPATHAIITKAIADGQTISDITAEVIEAMEKAGKQTARRTDASSLDGFPAVTLARALAKTPLARRSRAQSTDAEKRDHQSSTVATKSRREQKPTNQTRKQTLCQSKAQSRRGTCCPTTTLRTGLSSAIHSLTLHQKCSA